MILQGNLEEFFMEWPRFICFTSNVFIFTCFFLVLPGALNATAVYLQERKRNTKKLSFENSGQPEVFMSVISLLYLCCFFFVVVEFFFSFPFHDYLSHPLRLRWGGVLSEPKCPSICLTKYSLGIKPKPQASTPWSNSFCHSSEIFHYNLLNFKTDRQTDKS